MDRFLSDEEINKYIQMAKNGDNEAWKSLCDNFTKYVHKRAWEKLKPFDLRDDRKKDIEEELSQAGWQGFIRAIRRYDLKKGKKFITYATYDIDGEISKELDIQLNTLGITDRPKNREGKLDATKLKRVYAEDEKITARAMLSKISESGLSVDETPDLGKYSPERRTLQILDILKLLTDENHRLSKDELKRMLELYRIAKYQNGTKIESDNTLAKTMEELILELDPKCYAEEKDNEYRIKYEGYKEDRLINNIADSDKKKAQSITDFSYTHLFNNEELDRLIAIISFSDMISAQEKEKLIGKMVSTASLYYKTPFWDGEKLRFNPRAVHGRFSGRGNQNIDRFAENVKLLQNAINNLAQVGFRLNRYNANYEMEPVSNYIHTLSPYHLVVYHDNYYCIGLKNDNKRIWHFRVDLMSDIQILYDERGRILPIEVSNFDGLPISNVNWNPEKYMAEHLYMAYDEPRDIRIKIRNTDYTILHDWFGNHYEKTKEACEDGFDIVKVRTSAHMIIPWVMQYVGRVEVMDEEIRTELKKLLDNLWKEYY